MKKCFVLFVLMGVISLTGAQDLKKIELKNPDKTRGTSIMEAFSKRQSIREYSEKPLSIQDLSDLLWATIGINRSESGKLTAPTAMNKQEISLYVCFAEGAYLYDAKEHSLIPVAKGDFRPIMAVKQDYVNKAPVVLVIVADVSKFDGDNTDRNMQMCAIDGGIVSQNISIFCAGTNMATVPRGWMDTEALKKALKLKDSQHPILNHPVGYIK